MQKKRNMKKHSYIFSLSALVLFALLAACNGGAKTDTAATEGKKTSFPDPTDSTANGLHPHYPTEDKLIGQWFLPDPTDTIPGMPEHYMEFRADKSLFTSDSIRGTAVKWDLKDNMLIITHESGDPIEKGRMLNDTLIIEAISDTTAHYYNIHEPNFLMHLVRKK